MYDKLVLFLHYGAGDIFESREFAKEYMKKIPAKEYQYAHGKPHWILEDVPEFKQVEVEDFMDMRKAWFEKDNSLYINMWIGRDGKYVLPGIGCTVEMLYQMHNDILKSMLDQEPLEMPVYAYIPDIDYGKYWSSDVQNILFCTRKILVSNGPVHSNQASNFDFSPIIKQLCENFPWIAFYVTSKTDFKYDNLFDVSDLNLHQISLISRECDTIIGRSSGPQVFAQNLNNWMDRDKACLSFTYQRSGSHFVYNDVLPMRKYWSPATEPDEVYAEIVKVINR